VATSILSAPGLAAGRCLEWAKDHGQDLGFGAVVAGALAVFAVAVHGYHPYAEDGGLYMAGVKWLLDPGLYPQGTVFVTEHLRFSLFAPTVAGVVRVSGARLPVVLLALHGATVWLTLFGMWMLAARMAVTRQARAGAVALLACWLDLPVAGTSLLLMDPAVTARSFSTPCMIFALVGALDATSETRGRRWRGVAVCCAAMAIAAAMHPLMAAYAAGAVLVLVCLRAVRRAVRVWGTAAICAAALALAGWVAAAAPVESAAYVRIAMTRPYWYLAAWRWYEWVGLAAPLGILAWLARGWRGCGEEEQATRALARMAVVAGVTAAVTAMLFARQGMAAHLVARMQPLRLLQVVYLVLVAMLGTALGEHLLRRSAWRWGAALLVLGAPMFAAARGTYPASRHVETPWGGARNGWVQAFVWIRENTPQNALFALDADYISASGEDAQCFRAVAERSALPDYSKDGGETSITPALTEAWVAGQAGQKGLSGMTDARREAALVPLGVDWVVLQAGAVTALPCPYGNAAVRVCRLR
jgi:hypothetical protein